MKKSAVLVLLIAVFIISGCATSMERPRASGFVVTTIEDNDSGSVTSNVGVSKKG